MIYGYDAVYFKGQPLDALYRGTVKIYPERYFIIHNLEDRWGIFTMNHMYGKELPDVTITYSTDSGETWATIEHFGEGVYNYVSIPPLGTVYVDGSSNQGILNGGNYRGTITVNVNYEISGYLSAFAGDPDPSTVTSAGEYNYLFYNQDTLINASGLKMHSTLTDSCYSGLFYDCNNLVSAPSVLPATTIEANAYRYMFYNCGSLQSLTCLATDISAAGCTDNWLAGVGVNGTFYCDPTMVNSWPTGNNGCPSTWTIQPYN